MLSYLGIALQCSHTLFNSFDGLCSGMIYISSRKSIIVISIFTHISEFASLGYTYRASKWIIAQRWSKCELVGRVWNRNRPMIHSRALGSGFISDAHAVGGVLLFYCRRVRVRHIPGDDPQIQIYIGPLSGFLNRWRSIKICDERLFHTGLYCSQKLKER